MEDDWERERPGWRLGVLQLKVMYLMVLCLRSLRFFCLSETHVLVKGCSWPTGPPDITPFLWHSGAAMEAVFIEEEIVSLHNRGVAVPHCSHQPAGAPSCTQPKKATQAPQVARILPAHVPSTAAFPDVTTRMRGISFNIHARNINLKWSLAQVIAYTQVTPDHFPAKIYVEETAEALRNLTTPFQQFSSPTLRSNCSDLMRSMALAGESGGDSWQPSAADIAAVESCLGEVTTANASSTTPAVSAAAVKLLQAFIDSNGWAHLPSVHVKAAVLGCPTSYSDRKSVV